MKNSKIMPNVVVLGLVALLLAAAIALNAPVPSAAQSALNADAQVNQNIDPGRPQVQSLAGPSSRFMQTDATSMNAPPATLPNGAVVALVMQNKQDQVHAFNALTGEWSTLGGADFKVEGDDLAYVSNLAALVVQNGQDRLHAFSALTGEWATLDGDGFRVSADDIFKINDSIILVSQPGQEQLHAFSALTGEWATLSGQGFNVAPDDVVLLAGGE
ncbi:MAG: hypothetical protein R3A44_28640 [Caldilineaceae bacterium]